MKKKKNQEFWSETLVASACKATARQYVLEIWRNFYPTLENQEFPRILLSSDM